MSDNTSQQPGHDAQDNNKITKQYEGAISKLVSILKGDPAGLLTGKNKLPNTDVSAVIDELLKEKKEAKIKEFKERVTKVIESKVAFDKFAKEKQREFENALASKRKELIKEANDCYALLDSIDTLHKDYVESIAGNPSQSN